MKHCCFTLSNVDDKKVHGAECDGKFRYDSTFSRVTKCSEKSANNDMFKFIFYYGMHLICSSLRVGVSRIQMPNFQNFVSSFSGLFCH